MTLRHSTRYHAGSAERRYQAVDPDNRLAQPVLRPPPTPSRPTIHFPMSSAIGRDAPAALSAGHRAGEGLPSSRRHHRCVPRPIRRGVPHGCASRLYTASDGLRPDCGSSALPAPALTGRTPNDAAGFASCYGPHRRSPEGAFDAGLRPGPLPGQAASLLPGLLAATRTGLPPAGDNELTNSKIRCYITAPPPRCWAHERSRLGRKLSKLDH